MRISVESGDPRAESSGFRRSLGEFATGVTVITAAVEGVLYGVTSNSFASVSLDPPLVLWSIRRQSQSFAAFEACTHFSVNVLAEDQIALSQRFARSGPDKFEGVAFEPGLGGAPLLREVAASFECRRSGAHDGGDHLILLGEVERFRRYERQPVIFAKGRYALATEHPDMRIARKPDRPSPEPGENPISSLLVRAYGALASRLERERKSTGVGLSLMQARLLKAAHTFPDRTLEELLPELLLDFNASQDVLGSVAALGLVVVDGEEGRVRLTPDGERRLQAIVEHARANEEILFGQIPAQDLATMQRVLSRIIG